MLQVRETKDYKRFECHKLNRVVEKTEKLEKSMKRYGWFDAYPLDVIKGRGGKLIIRGGHHRFEVAKRLGIPIKYVISREDHKNVTIQEIEKTTKKWVKKDFFLSFVKQGFPDYIAVKKYMEETGVTLPIAVSLVGGESAGSNNKIQTIDTGKFKVGDQALADWVKSLLLHMRDVGIEYHNQRLVVHALCKIFFVKEVDLSRLKKKLSTRSHYFKRCVTVDEYLDQFEEIYNFAVRGPSFALKLKAIDAARVRKNTFGKGDLS